MGSLESVLPLKRDHSHQQLLRSSSPGASRWERIKSRVTRIVLLNKIDYLQWICSVGVFFFFVLVFQMSLPGTVVEKSENTSVSGDLEFLKELGGLDFGEDVFANLLVDRYQVMMFHVVSALRKIGYEVEVLTLEHGPAYAVWRDAGIPVNIIETNKSLMIYIDWLNYDALFLNSLEAAAVLPCLMQEPFKHVPVIWTVHEHALAARLRQYDSSGQNSHVDNWRKVFSRSNFIVFPTYILPIQYSMVDAGNYFVNLGSATEAWEADNFIASNKDGLRAKMEYEPDDFIIAIVGSQLLYKGLWLEHALALQALLPIIQGFQKDGNSISFKIIVLAGSSNSNYSMVVEVDDRVNGFLFPKENIKVLTHIMTQLVSNGKLSLLAQNAALAGLHAARNLMVSQSVEGYALLMENILGFPSEVENLLASLNIAWQGQLFQAIDSNQSQNITWRTHKSLDILEKQLFHTQRMDPVMQIDETFVYSIWEEEKINQAVNRRKQREDEELKGRTDQHSGTWEEVYKNAKRADRAKNDLHERDDKELERTDQPLCIYEPYYGEGTWPFLHHTSLYRGIGLSTKGHRPGLDDIDAPSSLPLLSNTYYRDLLSEYGGFFAIANQIDNIHKNAWIGFQSWRATARKESLSKTAETSLVNAIEAQRYGDTLFFWAPMDMGLTKQDFWSFCDAVNAGNCQFAVSEALKKMYGIEQNLTSLPPMPVDGGTWSCMHSWVLPTRSFLEFVMFSRMFVDALDSQFYDEHHDSGYCYLSLSQDKHCYSRLLELLINVWAYHSARRMVYVDAKTGLMQEQHELMSRRGHMWVKWFQYETLKSLDEELAELADTDPPKKRWLWPATGEVFWQGILEKERNLRNKEREKKKQQSKDKLLRMKLRTRQKALGKYVKPLPKNTENSNSTQAAA
nr:Phosphatidyl-myo-inositol mannosyltransferase [Ipomoea batatas]